MNESQERGWWREQSSKESGGSRVSGVDRGVGEGSANRQGRESGLCAWRDRCGTEDEAEEAEELNCGDAETEVHGGFQWDHTGGS